MSLEIGKCPYCEGKLYIWPQYNLCKCENEERCRFGERTIDELVELEQADYEDKKAEIIELMETYDRGMK